ncbi:MFS transporter [Sphingomonas sp. DG1-23]|uniref:MFS transporter n=1 Tax=Sphingomonas sp. DG1-23 TaxID=3068316 RepID=UPI00273DE847|nr:MFS transporter [Sphingomonas sp. DG1-23]MDP5277934.1 MFS transporter [Sphingomonas sp. DG1-23]
MATIAPISGTPNAGIVQPIVTAPMLALASTMVTSMSSFYLLLAAVPAHADALAGHSAAGLATGILMAATIAGEIVAPRVIRRCGRRSTLALALIAMALPCGAAFADTLALVLLGCAMRGLGLGILLVAACGLAARLAPEERRAEALGLYGLASAIPAIICVPIGPWALAAVGEQGVAVAATVAALAALAGVRLLPRDALSGAPNGKAASLPKLRDAAWPAVTLGIGAVVVGATVTFLPVAHPEIGTNLIAAGLLLQGLASAVARWASGRSIDRHGPQSAIVGGVAASIAGAMCLAAPGSFAVLGGMAISGIGFGVLQGATLTLLLRRASQAQTDGASALWNGAYDAGLGVGGLAVGAVATSTGFATAFIVTGVALATVAFVTFRGIESARPSC